MKTVHQYQESIPQCLFIFIWSLVFLFQRKTMFHKSKKHRQALFRRFFFPLWETRFWSALNIFVYSFNILAVIMPPSKESCEILLWNILKTLELSRAQKYLLKPSLLPDHKEKHNSLLIKIREVLEFNFHFKRASMPYFFIYFLQCTNSVVRLEFILCYKTFF